MHQKTLPGRLGPHIGADDAVVFQHLYQPIPPAMLAGRCSIKCGIHISQSLRSRRHNSNQCKHACISAAQAFWCILHMITFHVAVVVACRNAKAALTILRCSQFQKLSEQVCSACHW